ncbi:hypothetical protein BH09PAT4_BH09PAT4_02220 [soil metagenome]
MSPDVMLLLLVGVPIAVLMLWRINASFVFLSACLGTVLLTFVGTDASDFASMFLPFLSGNNLKLALLLLPVVLTTVFMIKTVTGGRLLFNVLPALGTGLVLALLVVPLLPTDYSQQVQASSVWHQLQQLQSLIVGASALACLFFLWTQRPKPPHHGKHLPHSKHH